MRARAQVYQPQGDLPLRQSPCDDPAPRTLTLGEFLAAATKHITATLPTPGRKPRRPLNFAPRRGHSASITSPTATPPTAERRAQVQILRTLGIIGMHQRITSAEMNTYDGVFATPIPLTVLKAIAALVDREIPAGMTTTPIAPAHVDVACET